MRGFPRIKQHGCHGHDVDVYTVSCLQSSINMVIRVLEEEHTNAAAIEHALFQVDCL